MPHTPSVTKKSKRTRAILQSILSIVSFVVCTAICFGADLGSGYLFYKEQGFHPDSRAIVKEVVSFEVFPAISRGKTKSGQLLQIAAGQGPVFLPDPNGTASPDDVARLINQLIPKYPQHRVLLDKLLAACISKQKAPSAAPLANPPTTAASGGSQTENKEGYYVVLTDGTKIDYIKGEALPNNKIKLISDGGIQTVTCGSIQLKLSNLSPEVKTAIESFLAAAESERKAEADRVAREQIEHERTAKEEEIKKNPPTDSDADWNAAKKEIWMRNYKREEDRKAEYIRIDKKSKELQKLAAMREAAKLDEEETQVESESVKAMRKAAEAGDARAQFMLGMEYFQAKNRSRITLRALEWFQKSANQGYADAQFAVGSIYLQGSRALESPVVEPDVNESLKWFHESAEQGHVLAARHLGVVYRYINEAKNYDESIKWFRKAAAQGDAEAQNELGKIYQNGDVGEKNIIEAINCFREAADQGHIEAQLNLGYIYYNGQETLKQDYAQAANWYKKAADQGSITGVFYLGLMYADGHGVEKNREEAIRLLTIALHNNYPGAELILRGL